VARDETTGLLWREAARRSGDPLLGLHAAQHFRLGINSLLAHLLVSCENLREIVSVLARYQTLVTAGTVVSLEERGKETAIVVEPVEGRVPLSRHQTEFIVGAVAQTIRELAERPVAFSRIRFRHECPGSASAYREALGCTVEFRASENSLLLESAVLDTPSRDHAAGVARRLRALAEEELQAMRLAPTVSQQVELALRPRLAGGLSHRARLEDIARDLHMSHRTLQRRLADESQTFASVLDTVRRELALAMLAEGVSHEAVASRLGFAGRTTLVRALRRWKKR
jgi:AraC-like DNA-binding protein